MRTEPSIHGIAVNAIDQEYNAKIESSQACSREKISYNCFRKAKELRHQADKLDNLGKLLDLMPNEVENALYSIIHDYLYNPKERY